jgi:hypothetical protein
VKAIIEIVDAEDGTVTVTGGCDPLQPDTPPSGAVVLWAYITRNCEKHMVDAGAWFANLAKEQRDD